MSKNLQVKLTTSEAQYLKQLLEYQQASLDMLSPDKRKADVHKRDHSFIVTLEQKLQTA